VVLHVCFDMLTRTPFNSKGCASPNLVPIVVEGLNLTQILKTTNLHKFDNF
jgi:hypothetical protein